jgi:hypothetical protein
MDLSKRLTGGTSAYAGDIKYGDPNATDKMNLSKEYDIIDVEFSSTCSNGVRPRNSKRIAFDYLGRPFKGDISNADYPYDTVRLIFKKCFITLTNSAGDSINITVEPETGFAQTVPL